MYRHRHHVVLAFAFLTAGFRLPAQVAQRRDETYDQFDTRRIREETANHRNSNPTFSGPGASAKADWSAWQGLIDRYNSRPAPMPAGPSAPRVVTAAEKSAAEARAREAASSASSAKFQRELENEWQGVLNKHVTLRNQGDLSSALRVGQIFDRGDIPAKQSYQGTKTETAFKFYHEALSLKSPEQKACYLGIIPRLLDSSLVHSPGETLGFLKGDKDRNPRYQGSGNEGVFAERCLTYLKAQKGWQNELLLALWYQHGDVGFGKLADYATYYASRPSHLRDSSLKPIDPANREAECLRLLTSVQSAQPSLGSYFIGAMCATYGHSNPLYLETLKKLAGPLVPLRNDKDNTYALVFQEEARMLLARLHLDGKVPDPNRELALRLLRGCNGFAWPEARLTAARLVEFDSLGTPHPLQEAVDDLESVVNEDATGRYPLHKYKAAMLRGLIKLTGETRAARLRLPPDLVAARAEFEQAHALRPTINEDEARCRLLYVQAIGPDAALAGIARQALVLDQRELWLIAAGRLHARGQGGLPKDAMKAIQAFRAAWRLQGFKPGKTLVRSVDAIDVMQAFHDLERERLIRNDHDAFYRDLLALASRHDPTMAELHLEWRLGQREPNESVAVSYRTIITELERIAKSEGGSAFQPVTMLRRAIADLKTPLEGELTASLATIVAPADKEPWLAAFAAKGPARSAALAGIRQPTAKPLVAALQAREKIVRGTTLAEAQAGLTQLSTLAEEGSLDALRLLARDDTTWRPHSVAVERDGEAPFSAAHWRNDIFERAKSSALARYESRMRDENFVFHRIDAQAHWNKAFACGDTGAANHFSLLQEGIPAERRIALQPGKFSNDDWQRFLRVEEALGSLKYDWWTLPPMERHKAACHAFHTTGGQRSFIEFYLAREGREVADSDNSARGNLDLLQAIYAGRGAFSWHTSGQLQALLNRALERQKSGRRVGPDPPGGVSH